MWVLTKPAEKVLLLTMLAQLWLELQVSRPLLRAHHVGADKD